jgi:transcriptional regulator with XRE-family HTH domain
MTARPDGQTGPVYTYRIGMATGTHHDRDQAFLLAFGLNLKLKRTARHASQAEFAEAIGVHRTFLGQLERAQRGASITLLRRIAEALHTPPSELLPVLTANPPQPTTRTHERPSTDDDRRPPYPRR